MKIRPLALLLALAFAAAPGVASADDIPAARVVLPWQDFRTLWEKGQAPVEKPDPAPRDYAISHATYEGKLDGEATVFHARMHVDVLKIKGWSVVPLVPASVALRQARVGGKDAAVYLDRGWFWYITDRSGAVDIDLDFAVSTFETAGQSGFAFQLTQSGGTEVTVDIPTGDALDFEIANAQQVVSEVLKGGVTRVRALLPATGNLAVSWQKKSVESAQDAAALEPRIYAEHHALIGVGDGLLQATSLVNYSILHKGVDTLKVSLPADVTIVDVSTQGLADWSVATAGNRQVLTATLNYEAIGAVTLKVDYEKPLPEGGGAVEAPDLQVVGVERVKGFVGIDARSSLEVKSGETTGARTIDVRELPADILGQTRWPILLGYRYGKDGWKIPLEIRQHDDVDMLVTIIDHAAATTVMTADGRRMTSVVFSMRNNRAQFLRLEMPKGSTPWSTFVGGQAVKPARADDGRLLIPLARSQATGGDLARFGVEIVYVEDGTPPSEAGVGTFTANLPRADVPATAVAWTVYIPHAAKIGKNSFTGTLRKVDWFTPITVEGATAYDASMEVQQQANAVMASDAMGAGVQPVRVTLPLDGQALYFEKLLVMGDPLDIGFSYKGLDD